jgi:hypothetical protein
MTAKASAIQRLPEERRLATLVAFATTLKARSYRRCEPRARTNLESCIECLEVSDMFIDALQCFRTCHQDS